MSRNASHPQRSPQGVRSAGDVLRGLAALLAVVLLIIGVPAALLQVADALIPTGLLTGVPPVEAVRTALTTPDDGTLFLTALTCLAWLGWATFTLAVLVEVAAQVRGRRTLRLPAMGLQQRTASSLVAGMSVLLSGPALVALPPAYAVVAATAPPVVTAAGSTPAPGTTHASTAVRAPTDTPRAPAAELASTDTDRTAVVVTVARGDTLYGIAQRHLGAGERYPDVADATRAIVQPDGRHLTDPDLIYPGWQVRLPQSPPPPSSPTVTQPATPEPGTDSNSAAPIPGPPQAPGATAAPSPANPTVEPSAGRPVGDPAQELEDARAGGDPDDEAALPWGTTTAGGLGALAAAGLVALLARKQSRQRRHRRSGERLPVAAPAARSVEQQARAAQDPVTVQHLDRVLRTLAARCYDSGAPLPQVQLVRLLHDAVELHLAAPAPPIPPFGTAGGPDSTWILDQDADLLDDVTADGTPPPYPALVAVGQDLDGAHVLLDLEAVGALELRAAAAPAEEMSGGDHVPSHTAPSAVLGALLVELATSSWADDLHVTVVATADAPVATLVETLGVERADHTDDLDELLHDLDAWAEDLTHVMIEDGLDGASDARSRRLAPDTWAPRVLLLDVATTAAQRERLRCHQAARPRLPMAVVTTTPVSPPTTALMFLPGTALARLQPAGLTLRPQTLPPEAARQVAEALRTADAPPVVPPPALPRAAAPRLEATPGPASAPEQLPPPASTATPSRAPAPAARRAPSSELAAGQADARPTALGAMDDDPVLQSRVSSDGGGQDGPAQVPSLAPASPSSASEAPAAPLVRVLGPVDVVGARGELSSESHRSRITEVVALLALHPHREHHLLDEAMWPGDRVPDGRRHQLISRARRWLGTDEHNRPYMAIVGAEGYRLTRAVRTDWDHFTDLVGDSSQQTSTEDLIAALALVRGQPFAGTNPRRYAWADVDRQDMIAAIADAAHDLATRAQQAGDAAMVRRAATTGLSVEPGSELLWRDALVAERLAGNREGIEQIADRLLAVADDLGGDLEPETLALLDELLRRPAGATG